MNAKKIAQFGLLTAMALVLGYVEQLLPMPQNIVPGIKLGLANTVLLYAVYMLDAKQAFLLMFMKVALSGFLFAGLSGMLYSFAGALFSLVVMLLVKRIPRMNIIVVSMAGAVAHNIGQLVTAAFITFLRSLMWLVPILLVSGAVMGFLTGIVAKYVLKGLRLYREEKQVKADEDE